MKLLTSLLLGGSLLFSGVPAQSSTVDEHQKLWNSLEDAGINIVLNDVDFCDGNVDGAYIPILKTIIVCQDRASSISSRQVDWTHNDLDTLRHEAHHVVQDCIDGRLGDDYSRPLFGTKQELNAFVSDILTDEQVGYIIKGYREQGASNDTIIMELEAFAVAEAVSPDTIADAVSRSCNV